MAAAEGEMGDFIISLAHFCEVCGPTSIICTQIAPSACTICHPCLTPPSEEPASSSYQYPAFLSSASPAKKLASPFETPPMSPTSPRSWNNPYFPSMHLDLKPARRFSEVALDADAEGCENCSFLVPKDISERLPEGAPGSPKKAGGRNGSPVLRSSEHIMTRGRPRPRDSGHHSPDDNSFDEHEHEHERDHERDHDHDHDHDTDREHDQDSQPHSDVSTADMAKSYSSSASSTSPPPSLPSSSSPPSPSWLARKPHSHTVTYLTTRQPISPATYSLLRRSYVRTISCEMLPRGSASGPLYFGDPSSGYTIAYVFRLPDPCARGRLRTYALIALGGRDSWRVSMAIRRITEYFESIANQIIAMASKVLQHEAPAGSRPATAVRDQPRTPPLSTSASSMPAPLSERERKGKDKIGPHSPSSLSSAGSPTVRNITPISSFLSAKKVDPDGYPRISKVIRAKGLAEIVGDQNFFVTLHAKFCMLLSSLVREFGTG